MMKSRNTANVIIIPKKYYIKPALMAIVCTIILITCLYFQKPDSTTLESICKNYFSIGVSFSLTFIAFSITALALLQLLQSKEWFAEVAKSQYFKSFLKRFLYSAKFCIILFIELLLFFSVLNIGDKLYTYSMLILSFFGMFYIVFWTWNCISDFITLFK